MRVLDAVPVSNSFHKMNLVEDAGQFTISQQACNRKPVVVEQKLSLAAARCFWRRVCLSHFYNVTRNVHDAEMMTNRRIEEAFS